jgi:hypothetical protein
MSGKKSSSGKESSVDVMPSVVTQKRSPKNLIAPHPYRFTRGGVPEAYCPVVRCTPEEGMEKV